MKKILCLALSALLVVVNAYPAAAAKKASLSFKKITLQEGKTKKITIKNKIKKAVYTYQSSSKKIASVYAIRINDTKELSCEKWRVSMG
ncbi:MAG: hypothetical protein HFG32_10440 [Eubacterium sp.]|nr:hypothetical protein [Eubacterium sp.]